MVQKAVNAIVRAQAWCKANPRETAHLLSRDGEGYLPVPETVLNRVFTAPGKRRTGSSRLECRQNRISAFPLSISHTIYRGADEKDPVEGNTDFLSGLDAGRATAQLVDDSFVRRALDELRGQAVFDRGQIEKPFTREEFVEIN